jgi:hypothetical protein
MVSLVSFIVQYAVRLKGSLITLSVPYIIHELGRFEKGDAFYCFSLSPDRSGPKNDNLIVNPVGKGIARSPNTKA